jgi:hypothetical protein
MNRKHVWSTSIFAFLITVTLAYQNCNNKKFATTAETSISGALSSIDGNGNLDGDVVIKSCLVEDAPCPDSILVRIYAYDKSGNRKLIGEVDAEKVLVEDEIVFKFSFVVPKEYACFKIRAFAYDATLGVEIEIPYGAAFQAKAFEEKCDDDPIDPPPTSGDPLVDIQSVDKDGRLVQVNGKCAVGAAVNFNGDIDSLIKNSESCSSGVFKHCNLITKYQQNNSIEGKQDLNGKQAKETVLVKWSDSPIKVITYETFAVAADEKNITITGFCNPTDKVKVSAYGGATKGETTCAANGKYSITAPILIPSLKNKGRDVAGQGVNSVAVGGSTPIISYDPDKDITPACAITQTVANASVCTKQAGTVKGTCHSGLPVVVYVNGNQQNIGYCEGGTFSIKNVLLKEVGMSNSIKIEQKTPYGRKCSSTKTMSQF